MKRLLTILLLFVSVSVFGQLQPAPSGTLTPLSTNQAYVRLSDSTYYFYNGTNYLWNYFLNKQQADKLYQPLGSPVATPFSLSTGYGLSGSSFNGSAAITFTADTASADGLVSKSRLATNLGGYVPSSRTITINGSTRDLSTNRIWNVGTVLSVGATAGTGISIAGTSPITSSGTYTITNTAPDQTVVLNAGTGISTSGTYPNFTITNTLPAVVGIQDSLTKKANRTFDNVASGAIANIKLANSTISGVALGSNLNTLTLGNGLTGTSYNGSANVTATADTAVVQTVANFFPKGDTRYAKIGDIPTLGTSAISLGGTANGLSYSAGNYRLHKVTATTGGVLTTGVDTIAGNKILLDSLTINKNPAGVYSSSLRVGTGTGSSTQTGVQVSMQLNDALLTETGHGFSDATEFAVTGMSYNSYDARPSFSGSATNRDHYTGFQFGPSASSTSNFTDLSFLRIGSNLTNINAANFYGLNMPQMSGTAFTNKYVVFSADTSAIIDIGGKIKNRKGGIEIIGTSKFNTTSWPTSAVSPATGRMLVGSDAIIIWNKATPTIGNKALITLGSKFGSDTSSLSGAILRTNLKNTTTGASELEIFTATSSSTNERAVRFDENQNTTFDGQILDAVIPHRATAADSIQVLDNGKFAYRTPSELRSDIGAGTGNGTVTSVTSANSDIVVATGTTTPVLTLATGTGTGSLVRATSPTLVTPNIGTPTASGTITSTVTSNSFLDATTATTSRKYGLITNTGGYFVFGVEPSTGGGIVAGSAAYSTSIGTGTATDLNLSTNGAIRQKILSTGDTEFSGNISAANLTASTKVNVASPSGTTGDVNTGQAGIYSYRSAGRYVRFNTSGTFNDFLSLGAKLVMNYGFSGTVENISMFEGSAAGDGQFIVGSPTATNGRFLLKGKDTGTTNYISRWFDSSNVEKFSVRNDGLATFTGALTGTSATFSSTISASNLTSGTYTPTLTNTSGIASSTAGTGSYQRIGNQVSGFVDFSATGTSEGVSGVFGVSLPIASNFSSATNVWGGYGVARSGETIAPLEEVSADTTNDRFIVKATLTDLSARTIRINFNYTIQ